MNPIVTRYVPDAVIYHANCTDGMAACWAVWKTHPNPSVLRLIPATHGDPLPADIGGRHIMLVDFCYDLDALRELADRAASVTVIDHHASTQRLQLRHPRLSALVDTNWCGCQLAYTHLFGTTVYPWQINMIADHDMGRFRWPWTAVRAGALMQGFFLNVENVDKFMLLPSYRPLVETGRDIMARKAAEIKHAVRRVRYALLHTPSKTYNVILADPQFEVRADVARVLLNESVARGADLVVIYRYIHKNDEWRLSLRSQLHDVSQIATMFAVGGGSAVAAGATLYGPRSTLELSGQCRPNTYGKGLWDYFVLLQQGEEFPKAEPPK